MTRSSAEADEEQPPAENAVERAAALDDYLGGFAEAISAADDSGAAGSGERAIEGFASGAFAGLLDTMLLLRQAAAADGVVPAAGPAAMPRSIGRHAILRLAGEGGFATVWEGFDTVLRRPVAVKVRRPELLLSESARRRFVREAEIAARLVHPHIVTIFEVGEDAGREFIAAEFCSGGSLASWLERNPGPVEPRLAAGLVRALAGAVAHAHAAGVIHRDIKPGNVLLAPAAVGTEPLLPAPPAASPGGLTAKLGDFGLGKLEEEHDPADQLTQLTRSGMSIGTPAWMAPEQIDRSFGPVGPATDVHGLGLLLHRLLTGRGLREGKTDAETFRQVLLDDPVSPDRVVRGVPRDLAAVTEQAIAKDPRGRYASAADLAADLGRWLDGRPTLARPVSGVGRAARWLKRRPVIAGLAAVAVAASLMAAWAGRERIREAGRTVARENDLRRQRAVAELRRGFDALRAGNVAEAAGKLDATRSLDPELAESLAGRWLVRRMHGEREIVWGEDPLAPAGSVGQSPQPQDLYSIAISAAGDTAAVAAADGRVHLLQGLAGEHRISSVHAHDEVNAVTFSPDGSLLATAGQDGRLRWWKVSDGGLEPAGEVALDAGPLYAASFARDGRSLATGGEDRVVRLVRLDSPADPKPLFRFEPPPGKSPEIESALFIDDARLAVSCGDQIMLLDAESGRPGREFQRPFKGNRNAVLGSLTAAPDGRRLAACGTDTKAHVWDVETGKLLLSLPPHPAWVQDCSFSPDGSLLATACRDGGVRVFDAETGRFVNRLLGHVGRVWSIAWEPSGTLLTAGADGTVRRWDPELGFDAAATAAIAIAGERIVDVTAGPVAPAGVDSAELGMVYAVSAGGDTVWAVDAARREARASGWLAEGRPWQADVDRGRRRIVVGDLRAAPPQVFPLRADSPADVRPTPVAVPPEADPTEAFAAWTPAGELVVRTIDGGLFWCPAELTAARRIASLEGVVHGLAVAPSGPPRVAAFGDRVAIHSLPRSQADREAPGKPLVLPPAIETTAVAWSPDAAAVACGARTGAVQLFDAGAGTPLGSLAPHERMIEQILFSPDGRILVTADRDCVRISDSATLTTFDELRPGIELNGMCLTADGARLVLGGKAADAGAGDAARLVVMELEAP